MNIPDKVITDDYLASEWTQFKNELENAIKSSGQALASNSIQIKQALARYAANATAYTDSGIADAYVLDPIANSGVGTNDSPSVYLDMQVCSFVAGNTNTGASTVNVAGVGVVAIEKDQWTTGLAAGDIEVGKIYLLIYSDSNASFELIKINDAGLASEPRPQDIENGMILSNGTDTDHDIDISIGKKADSTFTDFLENTSILTKQIDVDWSVGNNDGGFPSGLTLSVDTWYHIFSIFNPTTSDTDAGFDTSLTATNLLADATGYTKFSYLGSVLTDGSSNIPPGIWHEVARNRRYFELDAVTVDYSGNSSTAGSLKTISTPLGIPVIADLYVHISTSGVVIDVSDPNRTSVLPVVNDGKSLNLPAGGTVGIQSYTNSASQVRERASAVTGIIISTRGYYYTT